MARATAGAAFSKAAAEILRTCWDFHPTLAAGMGLHRYDGRLPDYSPAALDRRAARLERQLHALDAIDRRKDLSDSARLELGVLRGMLLTERFELVDARRPQVLPTHFLYRLSLTGYLQREYAPLDRRLRAVARLEGQLPRYLEALRASTDRRLPEIHLEVAVTAARGVVDMFERELPEAAARASPTVRRLLDRTTPAAVNELRILVHELETAYRPWVKREFALGRQRFERMVRAEHLTAIPVPSLLEAGMRDLARNRAMFMEAADKLSPGEDPRAVMAGISRDHPRAETLLDDTRTLLEETRQFVIDHDLVSVPSEERARVMETPRFYRFATAAMNSPGPFERVAREAFYYVTPPEDAWPPEKREEWLRHLNYASLRNIGVHEAYPGHYLQFLHLRDVRSTVLRSHASYAFTEGWAHYCEEMMIEQGFGGGDLRLRLAQIQDALLRDCRYVASIRMHRDGWTWQEAARFFEEAAYLDPLPAEREAKRGTWDPGYLNYTLGKLMIRKLRADWVARHRDGTLREFHDALLALGAPPLGLAREHLLGPGAGPLF